MFLHFDDDNYVINSEATSEGGAIYGYYPATYVELLNTDVYGNKANAEDSDGLFD